MPERRRRDSMNGDMRVAERVERDRRPFETDEVYVHTNRRQSARVISHAGAPSQISQGNNDGSHVGKSGGGSDILFQRPRPGQSLSSVIRRARRWNVTYAHAHSLITATRFRNPIREKMWTNSQISHPKYPETFNHARSPTADPRPIVAMLP